LSRDVLPDSTSLNENLYGAYMQYNEVYDAATSTTSQRNIPFVARPQAFAVKVPSFFVSGLSTAIIAPLMLVGRQTYTDLVNIGDPSSARRRPPPHTPRHRLEGAGFEPDDGKSAVRAAHDQAETCASPCVPCVST
jgi:hypothetical protein